MADELPEMIKFSDLKDDHPLVLHGSDLIAIATENQSSETGYSSLTTTPTQLAQFAVEEQTFANLKTSQKTVENSINQTISNLADDYDNTATYNVDDCVLYEGNLYKCITAIPVAEEWDSTHWKQVKAVDVGSGGGGELPTYEKSASGSVVSFTDGGDNIPVKSLIVDITAIQVGSGTPSPSNVRAISGFDNVEIVRNGKNFWDEQWEVGTINDTTGLPVSSNTQIRSKNFCSCKGDTTYYICVGTNNDIRVCWYDKNQNYISQTGNISNATATSPVNAFFFKIRSTNAYGAKYKNDIGINYPSTATTYEPYKGTTYTISLGSTVYMGTLNVTTGILTVTHAYQLFDGSENWQYSESGSGRQRIYLPIAGAMPDSIDIIGNIIEKAAAPTADYPADWTASFNHNANPSILIGVPSTITSAQDFKDLIANTNLQLVYELSAPVVIQLTPIQVRTLLGENNLYANSGDVKVEYFTEDAKPIADLVEAMESSEQKHTYSTTEHIVGTWIDNKPIYEKTVDIAQYSVAATDTAWTNLFALSNVEYLVGAMSHGNTPNISQILRFQANNGYIQVASKTNININVLGTFYFTFQYTKTTD